MQISVAIVYFFGLSRYPFVSGQISITPRLASSSAALRVAWSFPIECHLVGLSDAHSKSASICSSTRRSAAVSFFGISGNSIRDFCSVDRYVSGRLDAETHLISPYANDANFQIVADDHGLIESACHDVHLCVLAAMATPEIILLKRSNSSPFY